MSWFDWLILVLPVCLVMGMGFYTRRYVRGVADFLSAGRLCGRYVICVGDVANALSIIGLLTYVEIHYKTGFALAVTLSFTMPGKRITPIAQGGQTLHRDAPAWNDVPSGVRGRIGIFGFPGMKGTDFGFLAFQEAVFTKCLASCAASRASCNRSGGERAS